MIGPEGVKVPDSTQGLNIGDKRVSDLTDGLEISVDDEVVTFSGSLKNVTKAWTEFDKTNNTGHFVPVKLPAVCRNKEITIKGRVGGDKTVRVDDDLLLITRLENLTGITSTIEMDGRTLMVLDFTPLVPTGEKAYDAEKSDFGRYGKKDQYVKNLSIVWDGVKGTATGELLNHGPIGDGKVAAGHHFPLSMANWYDNVAKDLTITSKKSVKDKDIICAIDKSKVITVEYNGVKVLELDLTDMTYGE